MAREPAKMTPPAEKEQKARGLRRGRYFCSQIASELGVSKSTVINYLRKYPYSDCGL